MDQRDFSKRMKTEETQDLKFPPMHESFWKHLGLVYEL
jgi:hypothetical protein